MTNFEPNPWKNCYQLNLSKIRQSSAATEQEEPIIKTPPDTVVDVSKRMSSYISYSTHSKVNVLEYQR